MQEILLDFHWFYVDLIPILLKMYEMVWNPDFYLFSLTEEWLKIHWSTLLPEKLLKAQFIIILHHSKDVFFWFSGPNNWDKLQTETFDQSIDKF
jgi:hypothetical protein